MCSPIHCIDAVAKVEKTKTENILLNFGINKMERFIYLCIKD